MAVEAELERRVAAIRRFNRFYTSKIGVLQEMEYKGNTVLPEFVGVDVSK